MKNITCNKLLNVYYGYTNDPAKRALMDSIAARKRTWSALDILALKEISAADRLQCVLREELIDEPILHEFACRCMERMFDRINDPDIDSARSMDANRLWLNGQSTDAKMEAARTAAGYAALAAALEVTMNGEDTTADAAVWAIALATAFKAEWDAERHWQIETLRRMLEANE